MLHVDVISACCLCGASALVAAGVLLRADAGDRASTRAIRLLAAAFVVLAAGMFTVGFAVDGAPRHWPILRWLFDRAGTLVAVVPWLGLFFGTIPVIVAALALNLVNERLVGRLRTLAHTDELTGAWSRRALRERASERLVRRRSDGRLVAVLMIAIDHFKGINDRHGHPAGDAVLQRTAHLVAMNLCSDSMVTRYGGEEFAALLPVTGLEQARVAAERLRKAIEADVVELVDARIRVTVSVGLALLAQDEALDAALARADKALERARNGGRNRVDIALAAA